MVLGPLLHDEEVTKLSQFWLSLSEDQKHQLLHVEKNVLQKILKEHTKQGWICHACAKNNTSLDERFDALYESWYEDFSSFTNGLGFPFPFKKRETEGKGEKKNSSTTSFQSMKKKQNDEFSVDGDPSSSQRPPTSPPPTLPACFHSSSKSWCTTLNIPDHDSIDPFPIFLEEEEEEVENENDDENEQRDTILEVEMDEDTLETQEDDTIEWVDDISPDLFIHTDHENKDEETVVIELDPLAPPPWWKHTSSSNHSAFSSSSRCPCCFPMMTFHTHPSKKKKKKKSASSTSSSSSSPNHGPLHPPPKNTSSSSSHLHPGSSMYTFLQKLRSQTMGAMTSPPPRWLEHDASSFFLDLMEKMTSCWVCCPWKPRFDYLVTSFLAYRVSQAYRAWLAEQAALSLWVEEQEREHGVQEDTLPPFLASSHGTFSFEKSAGGSLGPHGKRKQGTKKSSLPLSNGCLPIKGFNASSSFSHAFMTTLSIQKGGRRKRKNEKDEVEEEKEEEEEEEEEWAGPSPSSKKKKKKKKKKKTKTKKKNKSNHVAETLEMESETVDENEAAIANSTDNPKSSLTKKIDKEELKEEKVKENKEGEKNPSSSMFPNGSIETIDLKNQTKVKSNQEVHQEPQPSLLEVKKKKEKPEPPKSSADSKISVVHTKEQIVKKKVEENATSSSSFLKKENTVTSTGRIKNEKKKSKTSSIANTPLSPLTTSTTSSTSFLDNHVHSLPMSKKRNPEKITSASSTALHATIPPLESSSFLPSSLITSTRPVELSKKEKKKLKKKEPLMAMEEEKHPRMGATTELHSKPSTSSTPSSSTPSVSLNPHNTLTPVENSPSNLPLGQNLTHLKKTASGNLNKVSFPSTLSHDPKQKEKGNPKQTEKEKEKLKKETKEKEKEKEKRKEINNLKEKENVKKKENEKVVTVIQKSGNSGKASTLPPLTPIEKVKDVSMNVALMDSSSSLVLPSSTKKNEKKQKAEYKKMVELEIKIETSSPLFHSTRSSALPSVSKNVLASSSPLPSSLPQPTLNQSLKAPIKVKNVVTYSPQISEISPYTPSASPSTPSSFTKEDLLPWDDRYRRPAPYGSSNSTLSFMYTPVETPVSCSTPMTPSPLVMLHDPHSYQVPMYPSLLSTPFSTPSPPPLPHASSFHSPSASITTPTSVPATLPPPPPGLTKPNPFISPCSLPFLQYSTSSPLLCPQHFNWSIPNPSFLSNAPTMTTASTPPTMTTITTPSPQFMSSWPTVSLSPFTPSTPSSTSSSSMSSPFFPATSTLNSTPTLPTVSSCSPPSLFPVHENGMKKKVDHPFGAVGMRSVAKPGYSYWS
ncbi:Stress response protein nst1 [Coelomomyces lativittatus]|nr:Stress response protein nst1 [Coelomomyces lativittatus]